MTTSDTKDAGRVQGNIYETFAIKKGLQRTLLGSCDEDKTH